MNIAQAWPIFKGGDSADLSDYRAIFVLPCFSKSLEGLMNNPVCMHLSNLKRLYPKQLGFQKSYSTDYAL